MELSKGQSLKTCGACWFGASRACRGKGSCAPLCPCGAEAGWCGEHVVPPQVTGGPVLVPACAQVHPGLSRHHAARMLAWFWSRGSACCCSPWGVQPRPKPSGGPPAGPRQPLLTSVVLCLDRFLMNMADSNMDAGTTTSEMVAEEVSLFSTTDMILFSLIVGVMTYWFLFRKKKEEVPEFTKIQTT